LKKITDIEGVYSSGISAEIYEDPNRLDLAFIYVPDCKASAGVFTQNKFRAACVDYDSECQKAGNIFKAIVVNAGNANAATGKEGKENVLRTAKLAAEKLNLKPSEVAIASTGVIGKQLPIEKVEDALSCLLEKPKVKEADLSAKAILTLDTKTKKACEEKNDVIVSGFAKGAGMIAPNMATMLGFVVTNANISSNELKASLKRATEKSFNMTSVDTDTSTNDLVIALSTGIEEVDLKDFDLMLQKVCISLAKQIAGDGEGAEKLIEVNVENASSEDQAKKVAKNIVNSPLVKTAVHGSDPNWGRLMMAIGKDPQIDFSNDSVDVRLCGELVFSSGKPTEFVREDVAKKMSQDTVIIDVNLNKGIFSATAWGCDLTKEYVNINTEYN